MNNSLQYKFVKPEKSLTDFVYCFSSLRNLSVIDEAVIIPNGKVDLIFSKSADNRIQTALLGLETGPKYAHVDVMEFFSVSFNPLAVEYIFNDSIADLVNTGKLLADNFWDLDMDHLNDFDAFCEKISEKIRARLPEEIDPRKRRLFEYIFRADGEISVKELAEKLSWSERQINRYFNQQFGVSLKTYCSILRFQAALAHIKEGTLFPQLNFTDQSHFIKEIKKLSGVSPKELFRNENDRFLQFLVFGKQ